MTSIISAINTIRIAAAALVLATAAAFTPGHGVAAPEAALFPAVVSAAVPSPPSTVTAPLSTSAVVQDTEWEPPCIVVASDREACFVLADAWFEHCKSRATGFGSRLRCELAFRARLLACVIGPE